MNTVHLHLPLNVEAVAELVAWRQAYSHLLDQFDAWATSRLVSGGLGAPLRDAGNWR
jgi:hypothetical protein